MNKDGIITLVTKENETIELIPIEQTKINGIAYLLAGDSVDEETAYILKDLSKEEDKTSVYEIIEDEKEINLLAKIFEELLEDVGIGLE